MSLSTAAAVRVEGTRRWVWRMCGACPAGQHIQTPAGEMTTMRRRGRPCGRCEEAVVQADGGLKCRWCDKVFHPSCEGVPQGLALALVQHDDQRLWCCRACDQHLTTTAAEISELERVNRQLQEHIQELEAKEETRKSKEEVGGGGGDGEGGDEDRVVAREAAAASLAAPPDGGVVRRPVDLNVMKRNMTIAKGCLDISLLSANANQLKNVINFGDSESTLFYLILTGIIVSLILQIAAGVVLIVAERFDINNEEEQERGDQLNTAVTCLVFLVLIINVFVASLGVDVASPSPHPHHLHADHHSFDSTSDPFSSGVLKEHLE